MSNVVRSFSRAIPLFAAAGLLAGCPAVEPAEPEPVSPTPRSGVWGLHIAEVSADGLCVELAPAVEGRVVRLDVDAGSRGDLEVRLLGLSMFGGHGDGQLWADVALPLPGWGYGWDDPVVILDGEEVGDHDDPVEPREDEPADGDADAGGGSAEPPPCEIIEDEDEEFCELPEPEPDPGSEAGVFVAFDATLRHAEALDGWLGLTVSNGVRACSIEARVDAAYLGDDAGLDDDVRILPAEAQPGEAVVEPSEGRAAAG